MFQNPNPIRLSCREWAVTALLCLVTLYLLPLLWPSTGKQLSRSDYRLPAELGNDYWMFRKWSELSRARYQAVVLGDSVVWGQYVRSDDTLTHHLSELAGKPMFANLGLDGLHPAAMEGLVTYYGAGIKHEPVIIHLNPLWMSSAKQDLQVAGDERFNHPKLLSQVWHRPAAYRPTLPDAATAVLEQRVPLLSWKEHLKIAYCEGLGLPDWTLENPYVFSAAGRGPDSSSSSDPGSEPLSWRKRGITPQDLPWIPISHSYQWRSFQRVIELLRKRGNQTFVVLGPFNRHMLTRRSQKRYQAITSAMEAWLRQAHIPYYMPRLLPTDLYADASHPLGPGYNRIAKELLDSPSFQTWKSAWSGQTLPLQRSR